MKRLFLFLVLLCATLAYAPKASAKGVILYSNGETLKTLYELPAEATLENGTHVNIGMHYECFSLFWMPVWNYGEYKYALVNDAEDTYEELTSEEAQEIGKKFGIDVPAEPSLPLLSQIGLKPIIILGLLIWVFSLFSGKDEEEQEASPTATE